MPFPERNFHFGTPQTNFSGFKKEKAKKKKKKSSAHFHTFPTVSFLLPFYNFPFPLHFLLFSLFSLPFFPLLLFSPSFLFSSFPLQKFPQNIPRVSDSPTSPTPNYPTVGTLWPQSLSLCCFWQNIYYADSADMRWLRLQTWEVLPVLKRYGNAMIPY